MNSVAATGYQRIGNFNNYTEGFWVLRTPKQSLCRLYSKLIFQGKFKNKPFLNTNTAKQMYDLMNYYKPNVSVTTTSVKKWSFARHLRNPFMLPGPITASPSPRSNHNPDFCTNKKNKFYHPIVHPYIQQFSLPFKKSYLNVFYVTFNLFSPFHPFLFLTILSVEGPEPFVLVRFPVVWMLPQTGEGAVSLCSP